MGNADSARVVMQRRGVQEAVKLQSVGAPFADTQFRQVVRLLQHAAPHMPQTTSLPNTKLVGHLSRVLHASARTVLRLDTSPRQTVPQALFAVVAHLTGLSVQQVLPTLHPSPRTAFALVPSAVVSEPLAVSYPDNLPLLLRSLGKEHAPTVPAELSHPMQELLTWTLLDDVQHHTASLPATTSAVVLLNALHQARAKGASAKSPPLQRMHAMEHATVQAASVQRAAKESQEAAAREGHDVAELAALAQLALGMGGDRVTALGEDAQVWAKQVGSMAGASSALQSIVESKCVVLLEALQNRWRLGKVQAAGAVATLREQQMVGHKLGGVGERLFSGSLVATSLPPLSLATIAEFGVPQLLAWWGERVGHVVRLTQGGKS